MLPVSTALLQVAVEYGAATSAASSATGGSPTTFSGGPLDNLLAVLLGPVGLIALGAFLLVFLLRKGGSGSQSGGLLGSTLLAVVGLGAAYAIARWQHLL